MMAALEITKDLTVTLVTVGVLLINPLTIIGILRSKKLQKEIMTPILVSVFVADFLQGIFLGIISTYISWANIIKPPIWLVRTHCLYLFAITSNIMSVTLLAVLQTIGVLNPLRFPVLVTKFKVWILLMITWITGAVIGTLQAVSSNVRYYPVTRNSGGNGNTNAAIVLVMLIILFISHLIIFIVVIKQQRKMRRNVGPESNNSGPNAILAAFKSAKRILAVTTTYLVLYPTATVVINVWSDESVSFFCFWLAYSQSIFNSMFYLAFSKEAWYQIKAVICCRCCQNQEINLNSTV